MEVSNMAIYMAQKIKTAKDTQGLAAAQQIYRTLFINRTTYLMYKDDVDEILMLDGYGDCIVTA